MPMTMSAMNTTPQTAMTSLRTRERTAKRDVIDLLESVLLFNGDAGIDGAIEEIDQEIDEHVDRRHEENTALRHGKVAALQRGDEHATDPLAGEDLLDNDGPGEQPAELQANDRDHGNGRVAERVAQDHPLLGEPFGAGGNDVVLAQ